MIGVRFEQAPSSLASYGQLSPDIRRLLEESRRARRAYDWPQAAGCALDACQLCKTAGLNVGLALAQLHLVDFYSEVGEIGQATKLALHAHEILQRQPARAQRHNEAVAAYALGLLHQLQLFGDPLEAWNWYEDALEQFGVAEGHWATLRARSQIETCRRARQWITDRKRLVTETRIRQRSLEADAVRQEALGMVQTPYSERLPRLAIFTVWRSDSPSTPFAGTGSLQGYITSANRVVIEGSTYLFHPVQGHDSGVPAISTSEINYCFALPVPRGRWTLLQARAGDYLFIRQQWLVEEELMGVVWEAGFGWAVVDFRRGPEKDVTFSLRSPTVIGSRRPTRGDPANQLKGYIVALLKPE